MSFFLGGALPVALASAGSSRPLLQWRRHGCCSLKLGQTPVVGIGETASSLCAQHQGYTRSLRVEAGHRRTKRATAWIDAQGTAVRMRTFAMCGWTPAGLVADAAPFCRDLASGTPWRNCRIELGGLAIQGAEAYGNQFNATFKDLQLGRALLPHAYVLSARRV